MKSRFILVGQKSFKNCADQLNANKIIKISVDAKTSVKTRFFLSFLSCFFSTRCANDAGLPSLALFLQYACLGKLLLLYDIL
jgi:hypothetical protein